MSGSILIKLEQFCDPLRFVARLEPSGSPKFGDTAHEVERDRTHEILRWLSWWPRSGRYV